jgi:hypothetical protein
MCHRTYPYKKGQCLLIIWIMTLVSKPWKIVTPLAPKHTTLLAMLVDENPPKITREQMTTIVKLSNVPLHLQSFQDWKKLAPLLNYQQHGCP